MDYEKTINGLPYVNQSYMAELMGVERHTVRDWQKKYNLPVVKEDKFRLCCSPIYLNWYFTKMAFAENKRFPKDDAALVIAIGHITIGQNINITIMLLQKGLNLPRQKAVLVAGSAIEWIRANLKPESHVNI